MRFLILIFVFFSTSVLAENRIGGSNLKTQYTESIKKVEKNIRKKMSKNNIVGMSVALVDDQEVIWAKGFGYADKENKVKAKPETIYRVGSITKLFNATAVMQMVEQGKMQLNTSLKHYLPAFSMQSRFHKSADRVTVKNILSHHSGIVSDWPKNMWGKTVQPFTTLVDALHNEHLAFSPDQLFSYSNVAVTLLGHGLQNVVDEGYAKYIDKSILQPLAMNDSYIAENIDTGGDNSRGYVGQKAIVPPALRDIPAGGLHSSVLDLAKFVQMIMAKGHYRGKNILKPATVEAMLSPQNTNNEYDSGNLVGLGWMLTNMPNADELIAWHSGGTFTFFSDLRLSTKHNLAVIVLANTEGALAAVDEISREFLRAAIDIKTDVKQVSLKKTKNKKIPLSDVDLENLPGPYSAIEGLARVVRKNNKLKVSFGGNKLNLIKREDGNFYLEYKLFGLIPISMGQMNDMAIQMKRISSKDILFGSLEGSQFLIGEKIQAQVLSKAWLSRLGKYKLRHIVSDDLVKIHSVSLYEKHGLLLADSDSSITLLPKSRNMSTEVLSIVDDQTAYVAGLGRGKGSVLQVTQENGKEIISIYGYQFERE